MIYQVFEAVDSMRLEDVSSTDTFTAVRQFEINSREPTSSALVEERKKLHEDEVRLELDARVGQSLADYMTQSEWMVEETERQHILRYSLTMKVVFKP